MAHITNSHWNRQEYQFYLKEVSVLILIGINFAYSHWIRPHQFILERPKSIINETYKSSSLDGTTGIHQCSTE